MKTVKLIKTTAGKSKVVDMAESIWKTILNEPSLIPVGTTYQLAARKPVKPIELMHVEQEVEVIKEETEEVEPIQVFKKLDEKVEELDNKNEVVEKKRVAPKKVKPKKRR